MSSIEYDIALVDGFATAVAALGDKVGELDEALHGSDGEAIDAAVDAVHAAYCAVEGVFK